MQNFNLFEDGFKPVQIGKELTFLQKKHISTNPRLFTGKKSKFKRFNTKRQNIIELKGSGYKEEINLILKTSGDAAVWALRKKIYLRYFASVLAIMVILNLASPWLYSFDPGNWPVLKVVANAKFLH